MFVYLFAEVTERLDPSLAPVVLLLFSMHQSVKRRNGVRRASPIECGGAAHRGSQRVPSEMPFVEVWRTQASSQPRSGRDDLSRISPSSRREHP